jgi:hypothetical protein
MNGNTGERGNAKDGVGATIGRNAVIGETITLKGRYTVKCFETPEHLKPAFIKLRKRSDTIESALHRRGIVGGLSRAVLALRYGKPLTRTRMDLRDEMAGMQILKWEDAIENLVVTVGKNELLDKFLAGSGYTAAFFLGLISSTSYTSIVSGDTMASHAGWLEAGATNAPTYSQGTRPAPAWSAASGGSKSTSAAVVFSITGTGTVKGAFLTTVSTKDGTTGILFSAGLFTGGDKGVVNTDTLNVTYSLAV